MSRHALERPHVCVIDSSIAVKWFKTEGESAVDEAREYLRRHREEEVVLAAPAHLPAEVLNAVRYANIELELLRTAALALDAAELVVIPIRADLNALAAELAVKHNLTINDALFPGLAVLLDCELVTADRAQARVTECPVRLLR